MSSTNCGIAFELARHEFKRTFYVFRDLRVFDPVLGLPRPNDERASLLIDTARVFTLTDDATIDVQTWERRRECLLMSLGKVQKLEARHVTLSFT
jgi:hypothetical protein